jgi:hypothetical protein
MVKFSATVIYCLVDRDCSCENQNKVRKNMSIVLFVMFRQKPLVIQVYE